METEDTRQCPIGIKVFAILFWTISVGLLGFFLGIFVIPFFGVGREGLMPMDFEGMLFFYFFLAVFPMALAIVAFGLWLGRWWARSGTLALSLANLAFVWFTFIRGWWGGIRNAFFIGFLLLDTPIQLAIIYYMFTPSAKHYLR
jgi:hypothetical protein